MQPFRASEEQRAYELPLRAQPSLSTVEQLATILYGCKQYSSKEVRTKVLDALARYRHHDQQGAEPLTEDRTVVDRACRRARRKLAVG